MTSGLSIDLVVSIVVKRPYQEQHFCGDKGYDYDDVHEIIHLAGYIDHIKHRRRRNEPKEEECPLPGEHSYPAPSLGRRKNALLVS